MLYSIYTIVAALGSVKIGSYLFLTVLAGLELFHANALFILQLFEVSMDSSFLCFCDPTLKDKKRLCFCRLSSQNFTSPWACIFFLCRLCHWSYVTVCLLLPFSFVVSRSSGWSLLIAVPLVDVFLYHTCSTSCQRVSRWFPWRISPNVVGTWSWMPTCNLDSGSLGLSEAMHYTFCIASLYFSNSFMFS